MNLQNQIKGYRKKFSLSQEELADKMYVTRQTISNWENGKNYPDIKSLLLMSTLFGTSIDELVKGDIDDMKECIDKNDVNKMQRLSIIYMIGIVVAVISFVPLFYYFRWVGLGIAVLLILFAAIKLERLKKVNNMQTYKEIVAFFDGEKLDEIQRATEKGKRNYQKIIAVLMGAIIGFVIAYLVTRFIV